MRRRPATTLPRVVGSGVRGRGGRRGPGRLLELGREPVEQGVDLDADGDQTDTAIAHIHDLIQEATFNLGLASGGAAVDENQAIVRVPEWSQGQDLDGDGGVSSLDATLHIVSVVASCGEFSAYGVGKAGSGGYVPTLEAVGCAAAEDQLAAVVLAGLSLLFGPISLLALIGLVYLALGRRRRAGEKHAGLRSLR